MTQTQRHAHRHTVSVAEHTAAYARRVHGARRRRLLRWHGPDDNPPPGPAAAWPFVPNSLRVIARDWVSETKKLNATRARAA